MPSFAHAKVNLRRFCGQRQSYRIEFHEHEELGEDRARLVGQCLPRLSPNSMTSLMGRAHSRIAFSGTRHQSDEVGSTRIEQRVLNLLPPRFCNLVDSEANDEFVQHRRQKHCFQKS